MPIANAVINPSSAQGQQLKSWVQQWYAFKNATQLLLAEMQQQQNDGADFTIIETQYGLGTGKGTIVYGIVFAAGNGSAPGSGIGDSAFGPIDRLN